MRFAWRTCRNCLCALPGGRALLYPPEKLANRFGRGDAEYALHVYRHHITQLTEAGFTGASQVLEIGPGRNLGTALLWWSHATALGLVNVRVTLWDVYANDDPAARNYWQELARDILATLEANADQDTTLSQVSVLREVAAGQRVPNIDYRVCSIEQLESMLGKQRFDLIYSHAALEHVWKIERLWRLAGRLTAPSGWHSHRIDLADHGRRDTNYIEMLEWSPLAWWLTMRFVPGAINRWRAWEYESVLAKVGLYIVCSQRERRDLVPVARAQLARPFRDMEEAELTTTAIDIVARTEAAECAC